MSKLAKLLEAGSSFLPAGIYLVTLDFENINIIFNTVHSRKGHLINMFIDLCKQYVHRYGCSKTTPTFQMVMNEFYRIHSYEYYYAKMSNKLCKHTRKWAPLISENSRLRIDQDIINDGFRGKNANNLN